MGMNKTTKSMSMRREKGQGGTRFTKEPNVSFGYGHPGARLVQPEDRGKVLLF